VPDIALLVLPVLVMFFQRFLTSHVQTRPLGKTTKSPTVKVIASLPSFGVITYSPSKMKAFSVEVNSHGKIETYFSHVGQLATPKSFKTASLGLLSLLTLLMWI